MEVNKMRHSLFVDFWIKLVMKKPLGMVGGIITLLLLLTGIFADFLAPYGMNESHTGDLLVEPSAKYWMGTDNVGRDILSRVIFGARISVIIGLAASTIATILNLIIGIVSGYIGGKLDLILQRAVDTLMCFPSLILLMVFMSIIGPGIWQIIIVLGIVWGIVASRVIRSAVIGIKQDEYIAAAVAIGCSHTRIFIRHILPNIMAPTIILFSIRLPQVILTEAALSFLGYGIPPPFPSWGGMLSGSGRNYMFQAPWMAIWPGMALAIVVYGVNMFGDAVRDLLDPRLRGGVGSYGVSNIFNSREKSE
jgi:peptide/nickel transport system permease protein|tara:strand:+ start:680 stop:1600 length:921 start_codon:yes stop_codon:yes gene_type:complete